MYRVGRVGHARTATKLGQNIWPSIPTAPRDLWDFTSVTSLQK